MKYSGEQINAAGIQFIRKDLIDDENAYAAVLDVLSYWRSEHEVPLKNALETVQKVALLKDRKAIFAKRLKRSVSIGKKLNRWSTMKLRTMQDIGGCRAIVSNRKKLYQIFRELKRLKEFKWKDGKHRVKDYIESPKEDGYRSVHIIGTFKGETAVHRRIEIQLRTYIQHYWATALEIVELFTHQALKSNQGDIQWLNFFKDVGEHFAQMDGIHLFEAMLPGNKLRAYQTLIRGNSVFIESGKGIKACCKKLKVFEKLKAFAGSLKVVDEQLPIAKQSGYVLLKIRIEEKTVETSVFLSDESKLAEVEYTRLENETAKEENTVVALVSSTAVGGIKEAYPNYFADSTSFLLHLEIILRAC